MNTDHTIFCSKSFQKQFPNDVITFTNQMLDFASKPDLWPEYSLCFNFQDRFICHLIGKSQTTKDDQCVLSNDPIVSPDGRTRRAAI